MPVLMELVKLWPKNPLARIKLFGVHTCCVSTAS